MKWIIIVIVVVAIFLLARCRPSYNIKYEPKDGSKAVFSFKLQESDSVFQTISLITTAIGKKEVKPMYLQAYFKGQKRYAEKILTIDLKLYKQSPTNGLFDNEIIFDKTYISCDFYSYYYYTYNVGKTDFNGNLNELIWPQ